MDEPIGWVTGKETAEKPWNRNWNPQGMWATGKNKRRWDSIWHPNRARRSKARGSQGWNFPRMEARNIRYCCLTNYSLLSLLLPHQRLLQPSLPQDTTRGTAPIPRELLALFPPVLPKTKTLQHTEINSLIKKVKLSSWLAIGILEQEKEDRRGKEEEVEVGQGRGGENWERRSIILDYKLIITLLKIVKKCILLKHSKLHQGRRGQCYAKCSLGTGAGPRTGCHQSKKKHVWKLREMFQKVSQPSENNFPALESNDEDRTCVFISLF